MSKAQELNNVFILLCSVALLIAFAMIALFVVFSQKKNKIIEANLLKELEMMRQAHSVELNALRSQMNPHFVYNSLNAIQYYIQRNEVELSENYLVKFSKLVRLFFEYSRLKYITIAQEVGLLNHYLSLEKMRFEEKLNFSIAIDKNLDADSLIMPSMMLQPIVENSVNHGIFHKKGNGLISIKFEGLSNHSFKVTISDDGVGLKKAREIAVSSYSNKSKSHSSDVLQERIDLLNQSNEWLVQYNIFEREDSSGTTVQLVFEHK